MLRSKVINYYNNLINFISFYPELYKIRRLLNSRIDQVEIFSDIPYSHPRGFIKNFKRRRITIVESYLKIIRSLESQNCEQRLKALKLLANQILHSKALRMPLNTARVQLALMKECIKKREDKRRQLELLRDFSISSYGQSIYIRKYLNELNIVEVPETGQQLKYLNMGWDFHVHDNFSYGRKTPTQLIIDAFIKGISEITIAHNNLNHLNIIMEAIIAGKILGIKINIGIEFSTGTKGNRFHYMYLFPYFETQKEFEDYLKKNKNSFDIFINKLRVDQKNRLMSLKKLIDNFNNAYLPILNEGYDRGSIYYIKKLKLEDLSEIVPLEHATKMHLGELLFIKSKSVWYDRVMFNKSKLKIAEYQYKERQISSWEHQNIKKKYEKSRTLFAKINPEYLRKKFFYSTEISEYKVQFRKIEEVSNLIDKSYESIKIIHPLEHGIKKAINHLLENYQYIKYVEIYNMYDSIKRDHNEILAFANFINILNNHGIDELEQFLQKFNIIINNEKLSEIIKYCNKNKKTPICGSDSTGKVSNIPGMGFIFHDNLVKKQRKIFLKNHFKLPNQISNIIFGSLSNDRINIQTNKPNNSIITMGKSTDMIPNTVGDENIIKPINFIKIWRYLNPVIKIMLYTAIGFLPSFFFMGLKYTLIWFGITSFRNIITDILSGRGYSQKEWHIKNVNFENLSKSLFFTGFSVPLLGFVKNQFDLIWIFSSQGIFHNFSKFFFICIINGLYLATHSTLRGFDKIAVRGNFFRSIFAWPFASMFAPFGDFLLIPSIVQAKFWSDFVAGIIEGLTKFFQLLKLNKRDLQEVFFNIFRRSNKVNFLAIIDLLYFFQKAPSSRNTLKILLFKCRNKQINKNIFRFLKIKNKKIDSVEKENNKKEYNNAYLILLDWFSNFNNLLKLVSFILRKYKQEQSIYLIDLISNNFLSFYQWLIKYKMRY